MGRGRELVIVVALVAVLAWWLRPAPEPAAVVSPTPSPDVVTCSLGPRDLAALGKLSPLPGVKAPQLTEKVLVHLDTTRGPLEIAVYPQAAPGAAKTFLRLVRKGYYDNTPIFRVVPDFVCQFGLNSRFPHEPNFPDDPSLFQMQEGVLAFAKSSAPDSGTTQVFLCYDDLSSALVPEPGGKGPGIFTAFGRVVSGDYESFKTVGDPQMGLEQGELEKDTAGYLKTLPEQPDMILKAYLVKN